MLGDPTQHKAGAVIHFSKKGGCPEMLCVYPDRKYLLKQGQHRITVCHSESLKALDGLGLSSWHLVAAELPILWFAMLPPTNTSLSKVDAQLGTVECVQAGLPNSCLHHGQLTHSDNPTQLSSDSSETAVPS